MSSHLTPEQARLRAESLFHAGYNCAQSAIGPFCEQLGVDFNTVMRLSQPFGGGMSRMREVCGAVSGILMAAGLAAGSADPADRDAKDNTYKLVQELAERFRLKHGSIICRELLGLVPMGQSQKAAETGQVITHITQQPESSERTDEYYKKRPCQSLVGDAAETIQVWLDERNGAET